MNIRRFIPSLSILLLLGSASCTLKKPEAAEQREQWLLSLNDSISDYKTRIDSATSALTALQTEIGAMVVNFDHVSNPREVEGYYIYKGWKGRYPLTQTGMAARITEDEGFELIAALSNGHFNQVSVSAAGESVSTAVVPHDQALNYRAGSLNTVCFYGSAADSVGSFIADHMPEKITLTFLNGGKSGSVTLSSDQKEMIAATWQLYFSQKDSHHLEKEIPMLSRRIDVCRRMLESLDSIKD